MRLKKLRISGFKSFVDATDIRLPADFVAVVGPNGCGKSNVIDAVRWVLGEASAKMLRGDSMADVIFNGSTSRKPVGKASVELLFDNSDGAVGGNFARFADISVKRALSRDGNSNYFINRIKTRRKDVLDLFRGTGLGPRAYSIIEQGMVSRIIEARPEDLRLFVEEAAGTSKYKDRRRETETRMGNTRDNLARVADIRDELDKQLRRLKRQANAALRYKTLKDETRWLGGQLLLLQLMAMEDKLTEQDRLSARFENALQSAVAAQRESEAETEKARRRQTDATEKQHAIEQEYHHLGAELARVEQRAQHLADAKRQRGEEIARLRDSRAERERQLESDQARLHQLQTEESSLAPQIEELERLRLRADEQLADAEIDIENWQAEWEAFNEQAQAPARQQEVQQSRIAQLQQHLQRSAEQRARLEQEMAAARQTTAAMDIEAMRADVSRHDAVCARGEQDFQRNEDSIQALQTTIQQQRDASAALRARQHEARSRAVSLRQIQAAALASDDQALQDWLGEHGLGMAPKLATRIRVADGWERAADRLLGACISAVCVDKLPINGLNERPDCAFTLLAAALAGASEATHGAEHSTGQRMLDKVTAEDTDLSGLLGGVYAVESLHEALAMQSTLGERQCAVTRDGVLVGVNWLSFASQSQLETGVLAREEEIKQLQGSFDRLETEVAAVDQSIVEGEREREAQRQHAERQRAALNQRRRAQTEMHNKLGREESRHLEAEQRMVAIDNELDSLGEHAQSDRSDIAAARELLRRAAEQRDDLASKRAQLLRQKAQIQDAVASRKDELRHASEQAHERALHKQRLAAERASAADGMARLKREFQSADEQLAQLNRAQPAPGESVAELKARLQDMLAQRLAVERRLAEAGDAMAALDNGLIEINQRRAAQVDAVSQARAMLERHKLAKQAILVRRDTQAEQIQRHGMERQALLAQLPEGADMAVLESQREELERKINRIGAVNLVAIEEFNEESERKAYLDRQHADLTEALDTLQSVIRKIDRETRSRFKETFEQLSAGFQDFFPRLFGGGSAELRLTSDDFLTAGVIVMARPPGKRNSHIHLLSGGEKALAAVALLFALFKLNPAPFCMLDEVDAPLDDANVARYCDTLKSLVKVSQMIVITHNKITMEAAEALVGVTMGEPGVSRLVSVDIDQAMEMAAQ